VTATMSPRQHETGMRNSRSEIRAVRRAERDGSGPVRHERPVQRNPGAVGAWGLFGEVLVTGLLIALVGVALITLPAALAAGVRHLRRYVDADDSRLSFFWQDVRRALLPGSLVGAGVLVLCVVLLIDIDLARSGVLPGGPAVEIVGWLGLAVLAVVVLGAAGDWNVERGWRGALRMVPARVHADFAGALYLIATAGFVAVATWALFPLIVPALGCAALAIVAIPQRRRHR
jgi:hypothetical protein